MTLMIGSRAIHYPTSCFISALGLFYLWISRNFVCNPIVEHSLSSKKLYTTAQGSNNKEILHHLHNDMHTSNEACVQSIFSLTDCWRLSHKIIQVQLNNIRQTDSAGEHQLIGFVCRPIYCQITANLSVHYYNLFMHHATLSLKWSFKMKDKKAKEIWRTVNLYTY